MKNMFFLILAISIFSCEKEDSISKIENAIAKEFSAQEFSGNRVAYKVDNTIKLAVSDAELMESFNNYSQKLGSNTKAHTLELIEVEGQNYIRFYGDDKSVSTVALINQIDGEDDSQIYRYIGNTVCKTTSCANCCGCIPSGAYCTECQNNPGDCERTTSG